MRLLRAQCVQARSALLFVTHDARLAEHFDEVVDLPRINRAAAALAAGDAPHHRAASVAHGVSPADQASKGR